MYVNLAKCPHCQTELNLVIDIADVPNCPECDTLLFKVIVDVKNGKQDFKFVKQATTDR